jgi:hypothetical protein
VLGLSFALPFALLVVIFLLGAGKALVRLQAVTAAMPLGSTRLKDSIAHLFLWPLASALYLYNALAAAFSRRIQWRGITYELKSPSEVGIIEK